MKATNLSTMWHGSFAVHKILLVIVILVLSIGVGSCEWPTSSTDPEIVSFRATVLDDDRARLRWEVECESSCTITIEPGSFKNLRREGKLVVERNSYDVRYKLTVQGEDNDASREVTVPKRPEKRNVPPWKCYYFKMTNPSSWVRPCFVTGVCGNYSREEAIRIAQAEATNYSLTEITEAQYYDPKTCPSGVSID